MTACKHCIARSPLPVPNQEELDGVSDIPGWSDVWSDDMILAASMPVELQKAWNHGTPFDTDQRSKEFELRAAIQKEKKEHPWLTREQVLQIVKDHETEKE